MSVSITSSDMVNTLFKGYASRYVDCKKNLHPILGNSSECSASSKKTQVCRLKYVVVVLREVVISANDVLSNENECLMLHFGRSKRAMVLNAADLPIRDS